MSNTVIRIWRYLDGIKSQLKLLEVYLNFLPSSHFPRHHNLHCVLFLFLVIHHAGSFGVVKSARLVEGDAKDDIFALKVRDQSIRSKE